MTARKPTTWVALIADGTALTAYAIADSASAPTLRATTQITYDFEQLIQNHRLPELERFITEQGLQGRPARLYLSGAGTVVHHVNLPPMKPRLRTKAIRTRLTACAGGRDLCLDQQCNDNANSDSTAILAAGSDAALVRALHAAVRRSKLRLIHCTALACAIQPPADATAVAQVILNERTTTIQLFENGTLKYCRDILLGRADFVAAYQRPIITADGPRTLDEMQALELTHKVGVPFSVDACVHTDLEPNQLWPLITPTLQKLRTEIEQTLVQHAPEQAEPPTLSVLSLPLVPGLADYLAAELQLAGPLIDESQVEAATITAFADQHVAFDLAPPEERFVKRLLRPAIAASLCAAFIVLCNASAPREARAGINRLRPAAASLQTQQKNIRQQLITTRKQQRTLLNNLQHRANLTAALPTEAPVFDVSRILFGSVPAHLTIHDAVIHADRTPIQLELVAVYHGPQVAGVIAADWARNLEQLDAFAAAEVTSLSGEEHGPTTIRLRALISEAQP